MRVFNEPFAFTINTSHYDRLVKTWERISSVLDFMGPDEYTTIVPLIGFFAGREGSAILEVPITTAGNSVKPKP